MNDPVTAGATRTFSTTPPAPTPGADAEHRQLLRGAGVTGTAGSLLMLGAFVVVGSLGLPDTSSAESLIRFPDLRFARVIENLLYLAAVVLWAVQHDVLQRLLDATAPVLSRAARTVGLLGVGALAASALLNVSTAPVSTAYQGAATDRDGAVLAWTAAQGVMDALLTTGTLLLPTALVLFGLALRGPIGSAYGWVAMGLGAAGVAGAVVAAAAPPSALAAVSILGALVIHLVVGVRCLLLARA